MPGLCRSWSFSVLEVTARSFGTSGTKFAHDFSRREVTFKCSDSLSHREVSCEGELGVVFGGMQPGIIWRSHRVIGVAADHEQWPMDRRGILEKDGQMCMHAEEAVENGFFDLVRMLSEVDVPHLRFVDRSLVCQWR